MSRYNTEYNMIDINYKNRVNCVNMFFNDLNVVLSRHNGDESSDAYKIFKKISKRNELYNVTKQYNDVKRYL